MEKRVACLTNGRVLVLSGTGEPNELESPYAEQVGARERALERRNAWKSQGRGAAFMAGGRAPLWGGQEPDRPPARVVGLSRGRVTGELCYAITTGVVSGVFAQAPGTRDEHRLYHAADAPLADIDLSFADEAFVCAVSGKGGTSAIGVLADDGRGVRTLTEGDVVDRAPRWVPGGRGEIVYSSAGIGRTRDGAWAGLAPFAVHRLRLKDNQVEVLVADSKYDYLAPLALSDSAVYAIRRPYRDPKPQASLLGALLDALLMPLRLLFALFQYLSFFSARYTGKPLLRHGNAQQKAADAQRMLVWGNLLNVQQDADDATRNEDGEAQGYELVRITPKSVEVVTRGVVAFDLAPDGEIAYSNGRSVYRLSGALGSKAEKLADIAGVEQIVIW